MDWGAKCGGEEDVDSKIQGEICTHRPTRHDEGRFKIPGQVWLLLGGTGRGY